MDQIFLDKVNQQKLRRRLAACLQAGQILMLPTDTVYGLSCRADRAAAVKKIFAIKRRNSNKPLLVLVSSITMAKRFCRINAKQTAALKKIWAQARPTSVLLPQRGLLPAILTANSPYLAVRLPKSIFLRKIVRAVGVPLVSTSANFSGREILNAAAAIIAFKKEPRPDLIVAGSQKMKRPSRLLVLSANGDFKILRK